MMRDTNREIQKLSGAEIASFMPEKGCIVRMIS